MTGKLLIVNSYHPNARYVPMGSFGICDYLEQRGHQAKIFNGALYPPNEQVGRLEQEIRSFQPGAIGLIMQWKEYTDSAIRLSRDLKKLFPQLSIIAGGMTAGYFAQTLLRRYPSIDGVIRGDAEEPLHLLLGGHDWPAIPNLLFSSGDDLQAGEGVYRTDCATLEGMSFAGLDQMIDSQRYLEAIEPVLGFPVFIGRGCIHNCQYCGGSHKAFTEHSGRQRPVFRSTTAVLRDLKRLAGQTGTIYIGFENSPRYLEKLFRLVADDPELSGALALNYGAWGLPGRRLLELYSRAFRFGGRPRPILEISPETAIDIHRPLVRDPALYFSNQQLRDTLDSTREIFGSDLRVELYYSRYHHTHESREVLEEELAGIHDLHDHLQRRGYDNMVLTNYHLATDVGSHNWDRLMDADGTDGLDTLLRGLGRMGFPAPGRPPMDNLCLYAPPSLDRQTLETHDRLVSWLELLRKQRPSCYFIAARLLGFTTLVDCVRSVIEKRRQSGWGEEVTLVGLSHLLRGLALEVEDEVHRVPAAHQTLVRDLAQLHAGHLDTLAGPPAPEDGGLTTRPLIEEQKLLVTGWDLAAEGFLQRLEQEDHLPPAEPTLNIYCGRRIVSFPRRMEPGFRLFDGSRTVAQVLQEAGADGTLDAAELRDLLIFITRHHATFTC